MKDWLNQHKDRLSTKELWDEDAKHSLTFSDLKQWLEAKDWEADIKQHDGKGKRKAPQSPRKLKKKKQDERDRAVVQRKHKKSKISRQSDGECYDFSYFVLFTYVFSLFLEVGHGTAALTHFSLTHIIATL